ncbi:hypothetical protein QVD99_003379 [Batrachochytrium dendrobatidis]|nr:hypothetical protein QVD99_003379 [Batrachochytrium dendrobatidis]
MTFGRGGDPIQKDRFNTTSKPKDIRRKNPIVYYPRSNYSISRKDLILPSFVGYAKANPSPSAEGVQASDPKLLLSPQGMRGFPHLFSMVEGEAL